ncbi:MAG: beta-galactosidase [Pseudopedobacter saltans]|uniref:Beta-galactosidase n=1 Tax=Pseudopedobacter saltans TaxID=151895 RepID=A0A2W5H6S4_9SPHI|nr:MAG: beta-galactosidase [Pseudopedobacter saltans]
MSRLFYLLLFFSVTCPFANSQSLRNVHSFNQGWQFVKNGNTDASTNWENVELPHTFNKDDMQQGKNYYTGDATYRKIFNLPDSLRSKHIFLRFHGVGQVAKLYINGKYIGQHKGAYTAFAFEITNSISSKGPDTILVKVNNAVNKEIIPVNMNLFPVYGGIYRDVDLITTNAIHFEVTDYASPGIYIKQKTGKKNAQVYVLAKVENKEAKPELIGVRNNVYNQKGEFVLSQERTHWVYPQGTLWAYDTIKIENLHLWNGIRDPYLYTIRTSIFRKGEEIDRIVQPLGLRNIELKAGDGVYLNDVKYPMYGVSRHQDWLGYGSALSKAQHLQDFLTIREMGATTVRLAHYPQDDYVYKLADSLGILIWSEIPFVNATSLEESDNAHEQLVSMIRQMGNHPSVYMWGLHNEVYSKAKDGHVPVLTRELNDIAKSEDPDRPTISTSGYGEIDRPSNLAGDVQGINRYYGWYEGKMEDLDKWGDYLKKSFPSYKVMLAEYGADANIDQHVDTLIDVASIDPVNGQFYPEEYQTETHIQQWAAIQKHPSILASYVWNMFEFAVPGWSRGGIPARNLKGLITFDRKRKKDAFYWYKANWNPEPMLYLAERRDSLRTQQVTKIQTFSNLKNISISLNGKELKVEQGVNDKHWIVTNVSLHKGKNEIQAKGQTSNGKWIKDAMNWWLK